MASIVYKKEIEIRYEPDIAVVGGGIAGISCALTCADMGMSVLLIERGSMLGGNSTSGGVANFCGNTKGQGKALDTVIGALEEFSAIEPFRKGRDTRIFNHEILASVLPELLQRSGVRFLLHSELIDTVVHDGTIECLLIAGPSGIAAVRAKQYIDCSGDGFAALRSGFRVMKGGENRYQLPMSYMYFVKHVDPSELTAEVAPGWFPKITDKEDLPMTSIWPDGLHSNAVKIKIPMYDSTDTESLTQAEVAARRKMMSVLDYHQRTEKLNFALSHGSPVIGIREGVRIEGDYILKTEDLRAGRSFDDAVAVGTYYLDGHKTDDDKRTYILDQETLRVPPYDIPLRSLIASDGTNLMMAGRCFSADQLALSSARVMTTCSMMGSATAVTASLAVKRKKEIRDISYTDVQNELLKRGAVLDKQTVRETVAMPESGNPFTEKH